MLMSLSWVIQLTLAQILNLLCPRKMKYAFSSCLTCLICIESLALAPEHRKHYKVPNAPKCLCGNFLQKLNPNVEAKLTYLLKFVQKSVVEPNQKEEPLFIINQVSK